ncbi:hypothetical protein KQX54_005371 [Cotesia glomerata]|uniref:Uncharacterized protein n=1 Tax=Cotesia glomerata TaxID=32391 RepID=A0AAV7IHX6_COTGL|nr:hypothetical protein KQX54_005371 [Cotesia glomerata]
MRIKSQRATLAAIAKTKNRQAEDPGEQVQKRRGRKTNAERFQRSNNNNTQPIFSFLAPNRDMTMSNDGIMTRSRSLQQLTGAEATGDVQVDVGTDSEEYDEEEIEEDANATIISAGETFNSPHVCECSCGLINILNRVKQEKAISLLQQEIAELRTAMAALVQKQNKKNKTQAQVSQRHDNNPVQLNPDGQRLFNELTGRQADSKVQSQEANSMRKRSGSSNRYDSRHSVSRSTEEPQTANKGSSIVATGNMQHSVEDASVAPTAGTISRPGRMSQGELRHEIQERRYRRKNIVISGDLDGDWASPETAGRKIKEMFMVEPGIRRIRQIKRGYLITLDLLNTKKAIMAQKSKLKGSNIWINDDLRQVETQKWLKNLAKEQQKAGKNVCSRSRENNQCKRIHREVGHCHLAGNIAVKKLGASGRPSGGQLIEVRKEIKESWKVSEWASGLCLQSKEMYIITEMECQDIPRLIWQEAEVEEVQQRLEEGLLIMRNKQENNNYSKISSSTFSPHYKFIKTCEGSEPYWRDQSIKPWMKEIWTKLRCGNISRHLKKGFSKDWSCRLCKGEAETLPHLFICREAMNACDSKVA